jgi:hypothetical protein
LAGATEHTTETWYEGSLSHLAKTEVCLTLTNKFALETAVDRANTDRVPMLIKLVFLRW